MSATVPGVKPAGDYKIFVRLPGSSPATLLAYPTDGTPLDGQLVGSPVAFDFRTVDCTRAHQVPSVDGSFCVCTVGYKSAEDQAQSGSATVCEPCPEGFYKDNLEADDCQACEAFKTTLQTGSARASDCVCERGCVFCLTRGTTMIVRQFGHPRYARAIVASAVLHMSYAPEKALCVCVEEPNLFGHLKLCFNSDRS